MRRIRSKFQTTNKLCRRPERPTLAIALMLAMFLFPFAIFATGIAVSIEGVQAELRDKMLASISIARQKDVKELSEVRVRYLHQKAQEEIQKILQAMGYYRPHLTAELSKVDDEWQARYQVTEGVPLLVNKLDIQLSGAGKDDPLLTEKVHSLPLRVNAILAHETYEQAKRQLLEHALDLGYLDAQLREHVIRIDMRLYQAEIVLHLETGPGYRFGDINLYQDILEPQLVRRYIKVKPGDPFTTSRLLALENNLRDSDYFSRIEMQPRREQAQDFAIPVDVQLAPRPLNKYTFGLGYGTDTGARGTVGWERRRLNRQGHRLGADLKVAEKSDSIIGHYLIPIRDPRTDRLMFTSSYVHERLDTSESYITQVGVSRSVVYGRWQETMYLNFQRETFTIADQEDSTQLLYPGITWEWVKADDRVYARHGSRVTFDLRGANESVVSDVGFLQGRLGLKWIRALTAKSRLIARGDVGATVVSNLRELPASVRFFAGGDYSVRGYGYNTLGPLNEDGKVIGGTRLMVGSLEVEQQLGRIWSAAVFYDVGNAVHSFSDALKEGAGVGLRWKSPIGQIRLDVAAALSEPDHPLRLHIVIGPDL